MTTSARSSTQTLSAMCEYLHCFRCASPSPVIFAPPPSTVPGGAYLEDLPIPLHPPLLLVRVAVGRGTAAYGVPEALRVGRLQTLNDLRTLPDLSILPQLSNHVAPFCNWPPDDRVPPCRHPVVSQDSSGVYIIYPHRTQH